MTPLDYDDAYSAGIRDLLIRTAARRPVMGRRRVWLGVSLLAGLSVLGAGGAIAATYVIPGADVVTTTSSPHTITGVGSTVIPIGQAPTGTNALETALTCLGSGTLTWPDGSSETCTSVADTRHAGQSSIPWSRDRTTFDLRATTGMHWRLTYTFSHRRPTPVATNAAGQTYGTDSGNAHPDLIAATATNGRDGYINAADEAAADPCGRVKTPAEAIGCTQDEAGKIFTIPVYESDGVTRIGVFEIGG